MALLTDNYGLRDVNYYPDFRETLEKANAFVERSGDATLTTGIAIHQGMIEDILRDIGPVTLSGITEPISSDNFSLLMSTLVEARHGQKNTPKDILFEFITALAKKISDDRSYDVVFREVFRSLHDGEILFASRDDSVDKFLAKYRNNTPWNCHTASGSTCNPNWAYPLLTSVSGNKSDRFIHRLYESDTTSIGACRYMNKITFTHAHTFSPGTKKTVNTYLDLIGMTDPAKREKIMFIQ